eukprot:2473956-Pyramimonas_sp.AAC.1
MGKRIARVLSGHGLPISYASQATVLGLDTTAGRRRSAKQTTARRDKARRRFGRILRLRQLGTK